jgi:4-hydroxy-4-methyl-2-oxoglutarate aldolase
MRTLSHAELLELKRWNTPTIYNGWEQITASDPARDGFNLQPVRDFMPQMGVMVGYAVTLKIQPGESKHKKPEAWSAWRKHLASIDAPKIVVVQDLDKPALYGSFWGEVNANVHKALGCVGTITDGAIRDVAEMTNAGFHALARGLCVGHAHSCPVEWDVEVEAFGRPVKPGQLIHADQHGFLVVPDADQPRLLEAARFMDANECRTLIPAARESAGRPVADTLRALDAAQAAFRENALRKFSKPEVPKTGEW